MVIKFNIGLGVLSDRIVEHFFPGRQIEIVGNEFVVKKKNINAGKKDRIIFKTEYSIDKDKTKIKDGKYNIKMVNAKLKYDKAFDSESVKYVIDDDNGLNDEINRIFHDNRKHNDFDRLSIDRDYMERDCVLDRHREYLNNNINRENVNEFEKYFGLEIKLYLTTDKVDTKCKIYNADNYDENDDVYVYLKKEYRNLFEDSIKKSKSIEDRIKLVQYTCKDRNYVITNETKDKIKNLDSLLKISKKLYSQNEMFICTNSIAFNKLKDISYEETSLFNDIIPIYKGWTGNLALDKIIYYMTYINMHTLNGIIFDDRVIYKLNDGCDDDKESDIELLKEQIKNKETRGCETRKDFDEDNTENDELLNLIKRIVERRIGKANSLTCFDALGLYYYIDNDNELKSIKKTFNINDKDFGIGKYIVIGPRNIKSFAKTYFNIYYDALWEMSGRYFDRQDDRYYVHGKMFDVEKEIKFLVDTFTKIVFFHELGHMAFSNAYTLKTIESNESAANWYASINMDFIDKYIIYFMTLLQPSEYKSYFTNPTLLISGKQLKGENDIKKASQIFGINNANAQTAVLNFKADAYKNYLMKVWWMLKDMYQ